MKIQEIMTREVESCDPGQDLAAAAMIMWRRDCGAIPVVERDSRRAIGMITDRDICMAVATKHRRAGEIAVEEVFSRMLHACQPEDDVHVAMDIMRSRQVRRIPVVDAEGRLQGIVSVHDLLVRGLTPTSARRSKLPATDVVEVMVGISKSEAEQAAPPRARATGPAPRRRAKSAA